MTMDSHLAELERRHHALEKEIDDAMTHPGSGDIELSELKKQKLALKDEITRLKMVPVH